MDGTRMTLEVNRQRTLQSQTNDLISTLPNRWRQLHRHLAFGSCRLSRIVRDHGHDKLSEYCNHSRVPYTRRIFSLHGKQSDSRVDQSPRRTLET